MNVKNMNVMKTMHMKEIISSLIILMRLRQRFVEQ